MTKLVPSTIKIFIFTKDSVYNPHIWRHTVQNTVMSQLQTLNETHSNSVNILIFLIKMNCYGLLILQKMTDYLNFSMNNPFNEMCYHGVEGSPAPSGGSNPGFHDLLSNELPLQPPPDFRVVKASGHCCWLKNVFGI